MPWQEESVVSQRLRLIEQLLLPDTNITAVCRSAQISRKTAYKWLSRYQKGGVEALEDLSRTPHDQPGKVSETQEKEIIAVHKEYPYWGPRKLRDYMLTTEGWGEAPSHTTFSRVLARHHCEVIKNQKSDSATGRYERAAPNELWQMDFKGSFMTLPKRCHPLTILDDCSRYSIGLKACFNETGATVRGELTEIFREFGLPEQMNVDNGNPWGSADLNSYTSLQVWLMKLGIRVTHSSPYHPQTNGKDERFHRTLKLEVLHQKNYTNQTIQKAFDQWRHIYNYKRPHQALGGLTPSKRYVKSHRLFPEKISAVEYDDGMIRKVHPNTGTIRFKGQRFRVGRGFCREYIAIKETDKSDVFAIFFMDNFIKKIRLGHSKK